MDMFPANVFASHSGPITLYDRKLLSFSGLLLSLFPYLALLAMDLAVIDQVGGQQTD